MIRSSPHAGFTLVEILLASVVAVMILTAIYEVFQQATRLRDGAVARLRDTQLRTRTATIIRNDLRNALVSGGIFASLVEGDSSNTDGLNSELPGYLKFTTTTGKDEDNALYGDVQEVEYYVVKSSGTSITSGTTGAGSLVRAVTRDLLQNDQPLTQEQEILPDVTSLQVSFFDGSDWQTSWNYNTADSGADSGATSTSGSSGQVETLPEAIKVDVELAPATATEAPPPPIEIMVLWTTQPFTSPTPAPSATPS